jgi:O-antigen ligase
VTKTLIYKIIFLALALTLPLFIPQLHGKIVIVLFLSWLFVRPDFFLLKRRVLFAAFILVTAIAVVGVVYSENQNFALGFLETGLALLILPLMIFSTESILTRKFLTRLLILFVVGVLLLNILSLFFISYDLWDSKNLQSNLIIANNVIVNIHPAFLSMYISFCVFFLVDQYFPLKNLDRSRLGWVAFSLMVLLVFLIWLNSRAGILAFSLATLFFIGFKWSGKTRIVGLAGLAIFLLLIILLPFSRHRFLDTPKMVLTGKVLSFEGDPSVYPLMNRIQIFKCNIELLKWPEIIYGYGTGDFRDELQTCFEANHYERPLAEHMDSHSEYFAQLHRSGIIGLGLFLALLIVPFRHAIKYKSPLMGAFIILFAITALFENVFSAQKGVTFFALFCPLLWIFAKREYEARTASRSTP